MPYLEHYFQKIPQEQRKSSVIAYLAALDHIATSHPEVARCIVQELKDQRTHLKLIASENFSSLAVQLAMGNLLTDKYAEGFPHHRFYAGCDNVDSLEEMAANEAIKIFDCDHAYVQPHSGADANLVAIWAVLISRIQSKEVERLGKKTVDELTLEEYEQVRKLLVSQKMMGMSLNSGGHLTHGYRHNISSKIMQSIPYDVDPKTGFLDYSSLAKKVKQEKPLLFMVGYSAYPRLIDFAKMREIADSVNAVLMVDMAHFAGLVAGKVMRGEYNPIPYAHIVTSTTHKTLRGPRGGLVLCQKELKEYVDKGCPLVLGGPLPHVIAAKVIAFKEASTPQFQKYAHQIVANAKILAETLMEKGCAVLTRGTDNHLLVIDVMTSFGLTGRQAESALRDARLTVNRNSIPFDVNGPWYTSGIRMGTAAITSIGMGQEQARQIGLMVFDLLSHAKPALSEKLEGKSRAKTQVEPEALKRVQLQVLDLLKNFPLYPELLIA